MCFLMFVSMEMRFFLYCQLKTTQYLMGKMSLSWT